MNERLGQWLSGFRELPKRMQGTLWGVAIGCLYLVVGWLHTVVFCVIVLCGHTVGRVLEQSSDWRSIVDRVMNDRFRD